MSDWIHLAAATDCPPGTTLERVADDRMVALFNVEGKFYALDGVCPHQGGPLGQGQLQGCVVTCPWHGWQFDVQSGQHQINASLMHPTFEVKVENEEVYLRFAAE